LFPRRAAESIPVEEGRGDPEDLLASSPRGLDSGIENDTVSSTLSSCRAKKSSAGYRFVEEKKTKSKLSCVLCCGGLQIDENVQKAVLCPTNFNLSENKERSHNLNSHTGGNWPQDLHKKAFWSW
jgi:hypothetical protein